MRKTNTTLFVSGILFLFIFLFCDEASAQKRLKTDQTSDGREMIKVPFEGMKNFAGTYVWPESTGMSEDILIIEDFSRMTAGTPDEPDPNEIASFYFEPGAFIDPSLTEVPGWFGNFVHSAGGKCALMPPPQYLGSLATPIGDYSGEITVTCLAKALPCELTGSTLTIMAGIGGYENADYANCEDQFGYDTRLYTDRGWTRITYTFNNYSANEDGFIVFSASGYVLIDKVEITTRATFIANPVIDAPTNFTEDGFTINWQPVRKAFNYYVDLYKMNYLSDEDAVYTEDFENYSAEAANDWQISEPAKHNISADGGCNGSKGIILQNGDTITSPINGAKYRDMKFWMRAYDNDNNIANFDGYIRIQVETENGWKNLGSLYGMFFFGEDDNDISLEYETSNKFANKYTAVRIIARDLPESGYFVIDNLEAITAPQGELVEVEGEYPGVYYDRPSRANRSYTFTGLEPEAEYYYSVKAHYMFLYSEPELHFAFGVASPQVIDATEVDPRGSYTANWYSVPKATRYVVCNYGVSVATQQEWATVLEDDFDKVDDTVTDCTDPFNPEAIGNYSTMSLDAYTNLPGWTGTGNTLSQSTIGIESAYFVSSVLTTPALYLDNNDITKLDILACGFEGAKLIIRVDNNMYTIDFEPIGKENYAAIDGSYLIPARGKEVKLSFITDDYTPFSLDYIKISQEVNEGDKVYTLLSTAETDKETLSHTFTGLDQFDFSTFAYNVRACYDKDGNTAISDVTPFVMVDLMNTTGISDVKGGDIVEVARYTMEGIRLTKPQQGINIVVFSDGSVVKEMVK